jgi:hypothetical protein
MQERQDGDPEHDLPRRSVVEAVARARRSPAERGSTPASFIDSPSMPLVPAASATFFGGASAAAIVLALACRIAWRLPATQTQSGTESSRDAPPWPILTWNGSCWIIDAIDGWERISLPWWLASEECEPPADGVVQPTQLFSRLRLMPISAAGGIQPDDGRNAVHRMERLWVRVRWPPSLRRKDGSRPRDSVRDATRDATRDSARDATRGHMLRTGLPTAHASGACDLDRSARDAVFGKGVDPSEWCRMASEVLRDGVDMFVDGVWT